MQIYNVYQSGTHLYIDEKENPDNKIVCNKYENKQKTLRLISDGTLPPRLYWALRNPKLSNKYFILPLINNQDLIIGTDISATPGLWDMLLIGTDEDYIIEGADIDQSRLTYVSDHFGRLFVRDNFLEELDFEEQCSPTFKIFYDEIMFRLDGVVTDEDIQYMNDKIDSMSESVKEACEVADEALSHAKGATKAFVYDTYSDMVSELNILDKTELSVNYHVMIREIDVPDLWVSGVSETSVTYTYTSNEDFVTDLMNDGVVQVGYFVLSALETQKVDLSEYVKNTDYATLDNAGVTKVNPNYGVTINSGTLAIVQAVDTEIDGKVNGVKPITPRKLDYAVMKALSDSKLEWTDEQKQLARTLFGSVGSEDYAQPATHDGETNTWVYKPGLVAIHGTGSGSNGVSIDANGALVLLAQSNRHIDNRYINPSGVICAKNLDYAVKSALSKCQLEWTEEEKALARTLLEAAKNEIAATLYVDNKYEATAGLFKYDGNYLGGFFKSTAGGNAVDGFRIKKASYSDIGSRTPSDYHDAGVYGANHCCPIVPANVDYAVKSVLSNPKLDWTDEEKAKVLELLGGVQKIVSADSLQRVYAIGQDGAEKILKASENPFSNALVLFGANGIVKVGTPTEDNHATTKKYVDDLIGDIETTLDSIITIQESLIGGESA